MRVFVSSTVFDLTDVRAELAGYLRSLGVVPVLSDDKLSDFRVQHDANSIETCLVNVDSCDQVIVVLDRRYGPKLGNFGYDDVSATHLEYRRAIERKIPTHVYVRDRLDADYAIWKRNGRSDSVKLTWVNAPKDAGLFALLEERRALGAKESPNWYSTFQSSVDLKAAVGNHLESRILPRRLLAAIQDNRFPLFHLELKVAMEQLVQTPALKFSATLTNVGGAPAFNFRVHWDSTTRDEWKSENIVAAGQSILMTSLFSLGGSHIGTDLSLIVEYESPIGIAVREQFAIHGHIEQATLISGGRLAERQFRRTRELSIDIEDAPD